MKRPLLILVCVFVFSLGMFVTAHAQQNGFVPLAPVPSGSRLADLYGSTTLTDFINRLFNAALAVGAILAVLRLAYAGYLYMTTDSFGHKSHAKTVIGDVILGLLLLLSIWLILRQINPDILKLDVLKNIQRVGMNLPMEERYG